MSNYLKNINLIRYQISEGLAKTNYIFIKFYGIFASSLFTYIFLLLKLSPNIVTSLSIGIGIAAGWMIISGNFIVGAILIQIHFLLDLSDGNLARLTNKCTDIGAKYDRYGDQLVRFVIFSAIVWVTDVHLFFKLLLFVSIYFDILIIHRFVLPFVKKHGVVRAKWKQWFLDRGIIPAFDIFLIYFLISIFAIIGKLEWVIYIIIIGKNLDWTYRVWECLKTKMVLRKNGQ